MGLRERSFQILGAVGGREDFFRSIKLFATFCGGKKILGAIFLVQNYFFEKIWMNALIKEEKLIDTWK